ncbi:hypothetical protein J6I39_03785 [bacterium]|nr:hypothetical protein [bacterium]
MVYEIPKNKIAENIHNNASPTVSPQPTGDKRTIFPAKSEQPATSNNPAAQPTGEQEEASAQSQKARARQQQNEVLDAAISKKLDGKEPTPENIVSVLNELKEELLAKQEHTQEEQILLSVILERLTQDKTEKENTQSETEQNDAVEGVKELILQRLADNQVEQTPENINVYASSLLNELLEKQLTAGLSSEENAVLNVLKQMVVKDKSNDNVQKQSTAELRPDDNKTDKDISDYTEKFLTGKFEHKDANKYLRDYLASTNKEFNNYSEEQKYEEIKKLSEELTVIASNGKKRNYKDLTITELGKAIQTLMYANKNKIPVSEIKNVKNLDKKLGEFEVEQIKNLISKYTPNNEEFKSKSPNEKLFTYIDNFLSSKDVNYSKLDEKAKIAKREEFINNIVQKQLGMTEWKNDTQRDFRIAEFAKDLDAAITNGIPLSKVITSSVSDKIQYRKQAAALNGYKEDPSDTIISGVIEDLNKEGKEITFKNIMKRLSVLKDKGIDVSGAMETLKTTRQITNASDTTILQVTEGRKFEAMLSSGKAEDIIENAIIDKDIKVLRSAAAYYANKGDFESFEKILRNPKYGLSDKQISECLKIHKHTAGYIRARHMSSADKESYKTDERMLYGSGNFEIAENSAKIAGKFFKGKDFEDVTTNSIKVWGAPITQAVAEGMNNREIMTFDEALSSSRNILNSDLNKDCKSALSFNMVKTAASPKEQLNYCESFSTIKDASVTEGLAAAEKFVDASVKSQYSSYVDKAIKNNGYSQAEINNINTARETGKTSYERNIEAQSTNSAQPLKSQTKVSTQQSTVTNISTAQISYSKSTVKLSAANSDLPKQFEQTLLQLQYQTSVAQKEKAMQDLQNIIDKIQNDQEVRAQKQAEIKAKEASTDEEIAEAIKTADEKSAQTQKTDEEKIANESKESIGELNEVVETPKIEEVAKKFNISVDDVKELQEAHRQGDLNTIYTKLGSISVDAQKKFVQFISRKDTATIIGFIRNRSTDKSLIKELCRLNPNLIKSLDPDLLLDCGIAKADIIKYAGASQLAAMLASQARLGHTDVLNQFYEALGYNKDVSYNNKNAFLPGGDGFYSSYNRQDSSAAIASNTIPNRQASHDGGGSTKPPRFYYDV